MVAIELGIGDGDSFGDALRVVRAEYEKSVGTLYEEMARLRRMNGKSNQNLLDELDVARDQVLALKNLVRKLGISEEEINACVRQA